MGNSNQKNDDEYFQMAQGGKWKGATIAGCISLLIISAGVLTIILGGVLFMILGGIFLGAGLSGAVSVVQQARNADQTNFEYIKWLV